MKLTILPPYTPHPAGGFYNGDHFLVYGLRSNSLTLSRADLEALRDDIALALDDVPQTPAAPPANARTSGAGS